MGMGMGINENLAIDIPQGGSSYPQFPGQIGIWNVGFGGGRKTGGAREKTLAAKTGTNDKLNPHVIPGLGIKPGPWWW